MTWLEEGSKRERKAALTWSATGSETGAGGGGGGAVEQADADANTPTSSAPASDRRSGRNLKLRCNQVRDTVGGLILARPFAPPELYKAVGIGIFNIQEPSVRISGTIATSFT
jgi:hypothetical protein